ncbi:MAG: YIP1 family protein [Prevotella sp.]|nr:YIP1 family protein [Prevotella sp.]MCM1075238.1 YIP1 family protein [Ruminococcus sp.]
MTAESVNNKRNKTTKPVGKTSGREAAYTGRNTSRSGKDKNEDEFLKRLCYNEEDVFADEGNKIEGKPNPWVAFLYLLINPKPGWRKIRKYLYSVDEFARTVFYPLLALMAICRFADKIYYTDISTGVLLQKAVAGFVAFFGGYYLVGLLARTFLPTQARGKIEGRFGQLFIMTIMSALTLSAVIAELFPWLGMLLIVPPIYCAYILAKGVDRLRISPNENIPTIVVMTVLCIGVPVGIYWCLTSIMPQA